jgi:hypothetical protein
MAQHNSYIFTYNLTGECHRSLHASTAACLFKGDYGGVKALV